MGAALAPRPRAAIDKLAPPNPEVCSTDFSPWVTHGLKSVLLLCGVANQDRAGHLPRGLSLTRCAILGGAGGFDWPNEMQWAEPFLARHSFSNARVFEVQGLNR
jgi:hypothetical protein